MSLQDNSVDGPLNQLISECLRSAYTATSTKADAIADLSLQYFEKDYKFKIVDNSNGLLCAHYPTKIVILESKEDIPPKYDINKISEYMSKARLARCRTRFPVPVILYKNKQICRSATISGGAEIFARNTMEFVTGGLGVATSKEDLEKETCLRYREYDVKLLRELGVVAIFDLMVEQKKVKYNLNVSSSEKIDSKENPNSCYSNFPVFSIPYPGCEFFRVWRENNYASADVTFDWSQAFVNAKLNLPSSTLSYHLGIDFEEYKEWSLATMTRNYLKLLLYHIEQSEDESILLHCISGWDRTPLFISLIRLSLWADSRIHQSLGPAEMLYLTIAYDWYLFGHDFPNRAAKGEEIFFFCFYFLGEITSDEFVMEKMRPLEHTVTENLATMNLSSSSDHNDGACNIGGRTKCSSSYQSSTSSSDHNGALNVTSSTSSEERSPPRHGPDTSPESPPESQRMAGHLMYSSPSSPKSIPQSVSQVEASPPSSTGSYLLVSGCGSVGKSVNVSPAGSHESNSPSSAMKRAKRKILDSPEAAEVSVRKQRLDAVRKLFLQNYHSIEKQGSIRQKVSAMASQMGIKVF